MFYRCLVIHHLNVAIKFNNFYAIIIDYNIRNHIQNIVMCFTIRWSFY